MALCTCSERPRCEWPCDNFADWSVWQPQWGTRPERFKFMCDAHFELYRDAMKRPIRGLDPMVVNDDYFRSSILEVFRHGMLSVAFDDREHIEDGSLLRTGDAKRYTKQQLPQALWLRRQHRSGYR
jgi:hypothetical protein